MERDQLILPINHQPPSGSSRGTKPKVTEAEPEIGFPRSPECSSCLVHGCNKCFMGQLQRFMALTHLYLCLHTTDPPPLQQLVFNYHQETSINRSAIDPQMKLFSSQGGSLNQHSISFWRSTDLRISHTNHPLPDGQGASSSFSPPVTLRRPLNLPPETLVAPPSGAQSVSNLSRGTQGQGEGASCAAN